MNTSVFLQPRGTTPNKSFSRIACKLLERTQYESGECRTFAILIEHADVTLSENYFIIKFSLFSHPIFVLSFFDWFNLMSSSLRLKTWQGFDSSHEQDYHSQWTSLREFHEKEQHEWGRAWSKPFIHQFDLRFVSRLFQSHLISIYSLLRAWRHEAKK